jgi:hypothetical protein
MQGVLKFKCKTPLLKGELYNGKTTNGWEPIWDLTLFALRDSWPEISTHLKGSATGHLEKPSWFSLFFKKTLK